MLAVDYFSHTRRPEQHRVEYKRIPIANGELVYPIYERDGAHFTRLQDLKLTLPSGEILPLIDFYPSDIEIRFVTRTEKERYEYYRPKTRDPRLKNAPSLKEHIGMFTLKTTKDFCVLLHELGHFSQYQDSTYRQLVRLQRSLVDAYDDYPDPLYTVWLEEFCGLFPEVVDSQLQAFMHLAKNGIEDARVHKEKQRIAEQRQGDYDAQRRAVLLAVRRIIQQEPDEKRKKEAQRMLSTLLLKNMFGCLEKGFALETSSKEFSLVRLDPKTGSRLWQYKVPFTPSQCETFQNQLREHRNAYHEAYNEYTALCTSSSVLTQLQVQITNIFIFINKILERNATKRTLLVKRLLRDQFDYDIDPSGQAMNYLLHHGLNSYGARGCVDPLDPLMQPSGLQASTPDHPSSPSTASVPTQH